MALELVALVYSPYSERARWALDHQGVEYRLLSYVPIVGEPALRLRLRRFPGRVTVPVLFGAGEPIVDSTEIARFADRRGVGANLIPADSTPEIMRWVRDADRALSAGRNLVTLRTGRSREALVESLPPPLRRTGPVGLAIARSGVELFTRKYGLATHDVAEDVDDISRFLESWRKAIAGNEVLLGSFSYADIVATSVLQLVEPVDDRFIPLGPATRDTWRIPELRTRFDDLVAWRDDIYAKYRKTPASDANRD